MNPLLPTSQPLVFDVLIVYSDDVAHSASDDTYTESAPFASQSKYGSYNETYRYFLASCKAHGLRAAFTTTADISGTATVQSVWLCTPQWKRVLHAVQSRVIFDKYYSDEHPTQHALLTGKKRGVWVFHHPHIRTIFSNKLLTYQTLTEFAIPTVEVTHPVTPEHLADARRRLHAITSSHPYAEDFGDDVVLKERGGSGGNNMFHLRSGENTVALTTESVQYHYALQPFIDATGFRFGKYSGKIDLRLVVANGSVLQSYIRIAREGEFRANAQQGGTVVYLSQDRIPADVLTMMRAIMKRLPRTSNFFALDFIRSARGHLYFIEGNTTPGLNWYDEIDERHAKQLIQLIVKNLKATIERRRKPSAAVTRASTASTSRTPTTHTSTSRDLPT